MVESGTLLTCCPVKGTAGSNPALSAILRSQGELRMALPLMCESYNAQHMKIYFAGSIRGGRQDQGSYLEIITLLDSYGQVLTEHLADPALSSYGETHLSNEEIYQRDVDWVLEADLVIAEVTQTSLGVGYELGLAEAAKKRIICLYRPQPDKRLSAMIAGNKNLTVIEYQTVEELRPKLKEVLG